MSIKVEGNGTIFSRLEKLKAAQPRKKMMMDVGYSTPYAIYVHENLSAQHATGQAKFLETPMKQMRRQLHAMIAKDLKAGKSLEDALLKAGQALLDASRPLVPVDTGALRDSGFVQVSSR